MRLTLLLLNISLIATYLLTPATAQRAALQPLPDFIERSGRELFEVRALAMTLDAAGVTLPADLRRSIEQRLGPNVSNFDLWFHRDTVQAALAQHPLVERASIDGCGFFAPRCFNVTVTQRTPEYALIDRGEGGITALLTGKDGVQIAPVAVESLKPEKLLLGQMTYDRPRLVVGLMDSSSPDSIRSGFQWVKERVETIESVTGRRVARADVELGVGMAIRLASVSGEFRFSEPAQGGDPSIEQQARRLDAVVQQLGARAELIRSVDLSFRKLAVIKF